MEQLFALSGYTVLPFWALMMFLPKWKVTERIMQSPLVAAVPAVMYLVLIAPKIPVVFPIVAQPTLKSIMVLLGSEGGATVGWIHYLAFDLLVGRWIYLDSRSRKLSPFLISPILFFTLMFGPIGFVAYLVTMAIHNRLAPEFQTQPFGTH